MEIKFIKELMAVMGRTGLKRLSLKEGDSELVLEREERSNGRTGDTSYDLIEETSRSQQRQSQILLHASELPAASAPPHREEPAKQDVAGVYITSPMVGTFYATPAPDEPSFVKVGDKIEKHTVVGIVEAMKVLNEIKANVTGTVTEVLVDSGQPVEFGTKLFRVI